MSLSRYLLVGEDLFRHVHPGTDIVPMFLVFGVYTYKISQMLFSAAPVEKHNKYV